MCFQVDQYFKLNLSEEVIEYYRWSQRSNDISREVLEYFSLRICGFYSRDEEWHVYIAAC